MNFDTLRAASWNLNGGVMKKLPLLERLLCFNDIVCLQEHFLSIEATSILELNKGVKAFAVPAKSSVKGRPSGGVAILVSGALNPVLYKTSDFFIAVKIHKTIVFSVYMPTDYRNNKSEVKFSGACSKLSNSIRSCLSQGFECILAGDMNCDLTNNNSAKTQLFLASCDELCLTINDSDFTDVHNSVYTSSLDFMLSSSMIETQGKSHVDLSVCTSDHFPIINSFKIIKAANAGYTKKWITREDWNKIDPILYQAMLDNILDKIKVPFQLLQQSVHIPDKERQVLLNIYCSEITHALLCAETAAVPTRKVKVGTEIPKWSQNPVLSKA